MGLFKGAFGAAKGVFNSVKDSGIKSTAKKATEAATGFAKDAQKANIAGRMAENVKNFSKHVLYNPEESVLYKPVSEARRPLMLKEGLVNDFARRARIDMNVGYNVFNLAKNGIHGHGKLIERSDMSLFGYQATGLGKAVAISASFGLGLKDAVNTENEYRQGQFAGTYEMGSLDGLVPQGHAYADNAGATGDLVLALNNQR